MSNNSGNSYIGLLPDTDHRLETSKGNIPGHTPIYKFGFNDDINGTEEAIWMAGGEYVFPTDVAILRATSDNAADASAGTGARTITIEGLDTNYNEVSVDLTMNGLAAADTTQTFTRVNRVFVKTVGTSGYNVGRITLVHQGAGTLVVATISPEMAQTQQAVYTVPASKTLYVDDINFTAAISIANKRAQVRAIVTDFGGAARTRYINVLQSSQLITKFEYPLPIYEKSDIVLTAVSDTTNNEIGASFQGVLVNN
jgi:hypothetical protein